MKSLPELAKELAHKPARDIAIGVSLWVQDVFNVVFDEVNGIRRDLEATVAEDLDAYRDAPEDLEGVE